ncbi:uncharacterized protein AKAW2_20536S [Aspergillus luchuensis]|uniref:Uncharacterized protein n=1 Tax=Aspergillus kawachii TaxID=1069201 RepID=A0A7R7WS43_ASPKA|nr:uncharacterized protein AKAW2_20536S [Aspergillus luchuensis]BCR95596.1 hypothetical protein AKAW2_20536S [Aspergillus luchuensis]BCS08136.1 hypothetical protein ALUC_20506S [Aspergillus luchuensis]
MLIFTLRVHSVFKRKSHLIFDQLYAWNVCRVEQPDRPGSSIQLRLGSERSRQFHSEDVFSLTFPPHHHLFAFIPMSFAPFFFRAPAMFLRSQRADTRLPPPVLFPSV